MNAYPTTVAALGRMAVMGDLYDARRDAFCGISAFCKDIPDSVITGLDDPDMKTEYIYTDKISDKFQKLDVSAELQVSVLGGLIKLEGSGRFLMDQKTSARSVKISLIYNIKTKQEKLNIFHNDLKDTFALTALENDYATHIVTGISWGANSIISCTSQNRENRDVKEISGKLSAFVKQATWSVEGKASVDFQTGDNSTENNFEIKVYGDILPSKEELPTTFEAALELVRQIPNLVLASNSGKGKPLAYQLTPIHILQNHLKFERQIGAALQTLEEASLLRVVQFAESFSAVQQQLNDFYQDALSFRDCIQPEKLKDIGQFKHSVALLETSFRAELSSTLTSIRSGQATTSQLEELLSKFKNQEESPDNVATKMAEWNEIEEKISFAQTLSKSGAKYIGLGTSLEAELLKDFESKSLVFYFSREVKEDDPSRWSANCQIFFQEMKNEDTTCKFYAVDCDLHTSLRISGKSCYVQVFQNGKKLVEDLLEDQEKFRNTAWAQIDVNCKTEKVLHKPNKRVAFCVPCTAETCDPAKVYTWKCAKCLEVLEFGFDTYVYCVCGRSLALTLVFKCPGPKHGNTFERPDEEFLVEYIDTLRPFKEYNILLLGKSGVGKSTWINCFINYLKFESLEKAMEGDLVTAVPSTFTVCNADNEEIIVSAQIAENNEEVSPPPCKKDYVVSAPNREKGNEVDLTQSCENGDDVDLTQSCENGNDVDLTQSCENGGEVGLSQSSEKGDEVDLAQSCENGDDVELAQSSANGDEVDFPPSCGNGDEVGSSCEDNVGADLPPFCKENKDLDDTQQFWEETEVDIIGTSATQTSKVYEIHGEKTTVRLIDTPGTGHHNGFDCSHTYYRNILRTLSHLQEIHGICIFLKSNDYNLSTLPEGFIEELLQVFGKDVGTNIVFCFTNTRGSFYKPGENLPVLQQHFEENDNLGTEISKQTIYCFDSEANGYLAATKNKPAKQFTEDYLENVTESWNKSVQETKRLLEHIMGLRPHNIKIALSMDHAKETILQLTEPLAKICDVIAMNINTIESEKSQMDRIYITSTLSYEDQEYISTKNLHSRKTIKFTRFKHPRVICSNISCYNAETQNYDPNTMYWCNLRCEKGFPEGLAGNPGLLKSFEINSGNCIYCSHSFKEHLYIYIEVDKEDIQIEDQQVTDVFTAFQGQWKELACKLYWVYHSDFLMSVYELYDIVSTCVKFAYFLKSNTVPPCTDEMEVFLSKHKSKSNTNSNLTRFRWCASKFLRVYQDYKKEYYNVSAKFQSNLTPTAPSLEEVQDLLENLKKLKFAGPLVKEALTLIKQTPTIAYSEIPVSQTTVNFADCRENPLSVFADLFL